MQEGSRRKNESSHRVRDQSKQSLEILAAKAVLQRCKVFQFERRRGLGSTGIKYEGKPLLCKTPALFFKNTLLYFNENIDNFEAPVFQRLSISESQYLSVVVSQYLRDLLSQTYYLRVSVSQSLSVSVSQRLGQYLMGSVSQSLIVSVPQSLSISEAQYICGSASQRLIF